MTPAARIRHWWRTLLVVVLGAALTAGAVHWVRHAPTVVVGQAQVVLIAPRLSEANPMGTGVGQLIAAASVVERALAGRPQQAHVVGHSLTLADQGLREATVVRVHNAGSQWMDDFNRPMLDIQVVSGSFESARSRLDAAVARIRLTLERLQVEAGVDAGDRARIQLAPDPVVVREAGGEPTRGTAGALLLGALLTTAGVHAARRRGTPGSPA